MNKIVEVSYKLIGVTAVLFIFGLIVEPAIFGTTFIAPTAFVVLLILGFIISISVFF